MEKNEGELKKRIKEKSAVLSDFSDKLNYTEDILEILSEAKQDFYDGIASSDYDMLVSSVKKWFGSE